MTTGAREEGCEQVGLVADFEEGEAAGGGAVGGLAGLALVALEEVFDFVETEAGPARLAQRCR